MFRSVKHCRNKNFFAFNKAVRPAIALFALFATFSYAVTPVIHMPAGEPRNQLIRDVLAMSLQKSDSSAQYELQVLDEVLTEARMVEYVKAGMLSVIWTGTQPSYEEEMLPVRIPILKGLLGHRIFIIRNGDQHRFDRVQTLADLRQIPLGQGRFWGDTQVLKQANMTVVDPVKYESLFHMLEGGRFDFFPRAIHEPWNEVQRWEDLNLTVERNILLVYPFAMYFFVSNDNVQLAQDIERGFRRAIADGSFDEVFYANEAIREALELSNLKDRKVFRLPNPNMHPDTPVDEKELWLNLEDL